jgi:Tol biopolymer transport system component
MAAEPGGNGRPRWAAFSTDGNLLAYSWDKGSQNRDWEVRLVDLRSPGVPKFRTLVDNGASISPDDFSPDGKSIAVFVSHKDRTAHIGLLSVADGSVRVIKAVPYGFDVNLRFSPDGRYLAYDFGVDEASRQTDTDIHIISVDGTSDVPAVVNPSPDYVLGWSQDGKQLVFASARSGTRGLWSLPVLDGRPQGAPTFLREASEDLLPMGLTASGALFSALDKAENSGIRIGEFDFNAGRFLSAPVDPVVTFVGKNRRPAWSPDGKSLAYLSDRPNANWVSTLVLRSTDTGALHEVQIKLWDYSELSWSPDGRSLLVLGRGPSGVTGLHRINAQTDEVTLIAARDWQDAASPDWSADASKLYYRRVLPNDEVAFVEYDLSSGVEKELIRRSALGGVWLSPDRRYIATMSRLSGQTPAVLLIPTGGGPAKELARVNDRTVGFWAWAPDGKSVFVRKSSGDVLRVPVSGGEPQKLDLKTEPGMGPLRLHPDGKHVAFQVSEPGTPSEVWVMENFLARSGTKK